MNLPNRLTVGRLVLTVFFVAVLSSSLPYRFTFALVIFVVAGITDSWTVKWRAATRK